MTKRKPPEYQPKKWQRNADAIRKAASLAHIRGMAANLIAHYRVPGSTPMRIPPIQDAASLCCLLHGAYRQQYETEYLLGQTAESWETLFLAAEAIVQAYAQGGEPANPAAARAMRLPRDVPETVYALVTVNEWDAAVQFAEGKSPLLYALLTGDDAAAQSLLDELPETPAPEILRAEVYYTDPYFHKAIYTALLLGDAAAMQAAMEQRVKQYRKAMWDYSTVLDICSAAQIKLAARRNLTVQLPIIELPEYYLDTSRQIDRSRVKLPQIAPDEE